VPRDFDGRWVEPFMGTGVIAFNVLPAEALLCDVNPHLINFYSAIQTGDITESSARVFLEKEGHKLQMTEGNYYYEVRKRFNENYHPLDFLFLNRAGFNGMIRFNKRGGFNIPFCKKPNRFSPAYITKISNQIKNVRQILSARNFTFRCQDFSETFKEIRNSDIVYCDPPYIDRHTDFYNSWDSTNELKLYQCLSGMGARFILSTWHHNKYRKNKYIDELWRDFHVNTRSHFYHVGGKENNRNEMTEALITNFEIQDTSSRSNALQNVLFSG
jgi:DNA adenine methylase